MPPRNYKSITVHKRLYRRLENLMYFLRLGSIPELIEFMVDDFEKRLGVNTNAEESH